MPDPEEKKPTSTPYGPHPDHVDDASGGADSSPYEDLPSGEKKAAAEKDKREGKA